MLPTAHRRAVRVASSLLVVGHLAAVGGCVDVATYVEHDFPRVTTETPFGELSMKLEGRSREIGRARWETGPPWYLSFSIAADPALPGEAGCLARVKEFVVASADGGVRSLPDPALANTTEATFTVSQWSEGRADAHFVASGFDTLELVEQRVTLAFALEGACGPLESGRASVVLTPRTTSGTITLWDRIVNIT